MENLERVRNGGSASLSLRDGDSSSRERTGRGFARGRAGLPEPRIRAPVLTTLSSRCLLIEPEDRGSATAVFYGVLHLLRLAPTEPVATLREAAFHGILEARRGLAPRKPRRASPLGGGHAPKPCPPESLTIRINRLSRTQKEDAMPPVDDTSALSPQAPARADRARDRAGYTGAYREPGTVDIQEVVAVQTARGPQ